MLKAFVSALALAAASLAAPAHAQSWYVRGDVGYLVDGALDLEQREFDGLSIGGDSDLDEDWSGHVGLGHAYGNGLRVELEAAYRDNEIQPAANYSGGEASSWAGLINGYYDFNRGGAIQPYLGLGIGVANVEASFSDLTPTPGFAVDDDATRFAYQGLAGIGLRASRRLTFDLGYRYFAVRDAEFATPFGDLEGDYVHQAVTLGLRLAFGGPAAATAADRGPASDAVPPPPPTTPSAPATPPAATCPPGSVTVYFDWDSATLGADAAATLDKLAADAKGCAAQIEVSGHADRSGSVGYNLALSQRRANVVRDALIARGFTAAQITTEARGEGVLARATADGVREALNRRAVVVVSVR